LPRRAARRARLLGVGAANSVSWYREAPL
jgi:hypothetical protein